MKELNNDHYGNDKIVIVVIMIQVVIIIIQVMTMIRIIIIMIIITVMIIIISIIITIIVIRHKMCPTMKPFTTHYSIIFLEMTAAATKSTI